MNRAWTLLGLLALLTGCGGASDGPAAGPGATSTTTGPAVTSPATESGASLPKLPRTLKARCGDDLPARLFPIRGRDPQTRLAAVQLGRGPDTAILLHQTDGNGMCGWVPYASWLADHGVRAIVIDQCAYFYSACSDKTLYDPPAMLRLVVRWARAHGARWVTVVGASMGGSVALGTGQSAGVDAIVDLSGPATWIDVPGALRAAPHVRVPLLVAVNRGTDPDAFPILRRAVAIAPAATKRFVAAPPGHGWDLVTRLRDGAALRTDVEATPLGILVRDWVKGIAR